MDLSILQELAPENIYGIIGEDGITRLTTAFYHQVPADDILRPMYPEDALADAAMRLREFLVFRFGGPQRYITQRGHPQLRMRHAPFAIDQQARDRWISLMENAVQQQAFPAEVTKALRIFFHDVATFLINRPAS